MIPIPHHSPCAMYTCQWWFSVFPGSCVCPQSNLNTFPTSDLAAGTLGAPTAAPSTHSSTSRFPTLDFPLNGIVQQWPSVTGFFLRWSWHPCWQSADHQRIINSTPWSVYPCAGTILAWFLLLCSSSQTGKFKSSYNTWFLFLRIVLTFWVPCNSIRTLELTCQCLHTSQLGSSPVSEVRPS